MNRYPTPASDPRTKAALRRFFLFADWRGRGAVARCWYGEGGGWAGLWGANTYCEERAAAIIRSWLFRPGLLKIGRVRPYSLLVRRASTPRRRGQYQAGTKKPGRREVA